MAEQTNPPQQAAAPAPNTTTPPRTPEPPQQRLPVDASHFRNGRITRHGMLHAIKSGGSVILNGRHIARAEDIPTDVELAETAEDRAAARDRLEQQQRDIERQLASLKDDQQPNRKK